MAQDGEIRQHPNGGTYKRVGGKWVLQGGGAPAPVPLTPADPKLPLEVERLRQEIATTNANNAKTPLELENQRLQNERLRREIDKLSNPKPGGEVTAEARSAALAKVAAARSLASQLDRVQELYDRQLGGGRSLAEFFPTPGNAEFDAAAEGLMPLARQAFRVPGSGSDTEREAQYIENILPNRWSFDEKNEQRIRQLREMIEDVQREYGPIAGEAPAPKDDDQSAALPGAGGMDRSTRISANGPRGGPQVELAKGGTKRSFDPELSGLIEAMIRNPKFSQDEINAELRRRRADPIGNVAEVRAYLAKNPNYSGFVQATRETPIDNPALNEFVQSPLGTGVANLANMGGFGIPQALAGEEGFNSINEQNPGAAMAGQVGGALTGTGLLGAVGRKTIGQVAPKMMGGGSKGAFGRNIATDATYGGIYGGATEGDPLKGAALASLGSAGGQGAASLVGRAATPVVAPVAKRLNDAGVTLSLGQILRDRGGASGRIVAGIEDRLAGLPIVGDMMAGVRTRGIEDANVLQLNETLAPIGAKVSQAGNAGFAQADEAVGAAYEKALGPMRLAADEGFNAALESASDYADGIVRPNMGPGGEITGDGLQTIKRLIDSEIANNARVPGGFKNVPQLQGLRDELFSLADRQAPDLMSQYRAADEAYSGLVPIRTATANAGNNSGVWSPAQLGVAMRSTDRSVGKRVTARGERPGQSLQQDMQALLPSKVPDSGTAGRLAVGALAGLPMLGGGAGYVDPGTAAALSLPALLYTKAGQKAAAKVLLGDRPAAVKALGSKVRKHKGMFGAAAAAPLITQ